MSTEHLRDIPKDHSNRANWWHVDSADRKIGWLWPEDMLAMIDSIWGVRQGIKNFAVYAGLNRKTIEQYCNGKVAIPKHIALLVYGLQQIMLDNGAHKKATPWRALPRIEADWLPKERQDETYELARRQYP